MKLFQQMLVASTAVGLIAPIAVQASDIDIDGMKSYARAKSKKKKQFSSKTFSNELANVKASGESTKTQINEFEAGGFSETTTLDGKAVFTVAALEAPDGVASLDEKTHFQYMYQMNLNTSFTGDDNLYVRIKTGNGVKDKTWSEGPYGTYLSSSNQKSDQLTVDKMWYTMPVGERNTFFVGPKIENYYMHGTTPSLYKPVLKQFTLGGNAAAYGASTSPGAGWVYRADNGFAVSSNFTTQKGNENSGILTDEGKTSWATQIGWTKPRYSFSAIVNLKYNGWTDKYFTTATGKLRPGVGDSTNIGLRAWWRPEETGSAAPSVSLGFDASSVDGAAGSKSTNMLFVGLNWQDILNPDDRIGLALGQPQKNESESSSPFAWELYYSYPMNDSVTITPAIFGGVDRNGTTGQDLQGYVLETTFKF